MTPTLHIQLLGGFRLIADDTPVTTLDSPRLQALLAYLLLHRTAPHARAHLAFQLWPDTTEAQAHANLRTLLHRLRHALPNADEFLHVDAQNVQWRADAPATLDVADFERALAQAAAAERALAQAAACAALREAAEWYRGDLLPGWYDDWVLVERERQRQAFLAALERLVLLLEQQQDYGAAIGYAQRLLRHDPLHEAMYQHLMRLHARSGDRASALRVYHTCATALERELAVEPSPATRGVYERLVHGDAPVQPAAPPPARVHPMQVDAPILRGPPPPTRIGIAPLVGRQDEWARVQAAWQATATGGPHMLVLAGEAGIGKTRLAEELLDWAGRQGIVTADARCYAAEGGLAYAPVTAWLRTGAIHAALTTLDDVWLTDVARLLPELLAERPDLLHPGPLTDAWQRQRLFESLARATLGNQHPRLLLLDDLQWCDRETLAWLHYLLRFDPQARLLLVGTVRPEELAPDHPLTTLLHAVRRSGQVREIALGPLNAAGTAALAAHVAGRDLDPALLAHLHHETEGNPLFVVETVRAGALAPTELVQPAVGETTGPPGPPLPPAVQAVIAARLAQLSPAAREVASLAATIGRAFTFPVLARASDADEPTLVRGLDELWQRRIVREQGEDAYDFSHDKLRETAYTELSAARRRLLHRRVAEAFETVYASDLDVVNGQRAAHDEQTDAANLTAVYPLLAYHWRLAGDEAKTVAYLAKAGEQALHSGAYQEAVRFLRDALALDARQAPGSDQVLRARWERQLGEAYFGLGQHADGRMHLEQALALLDRPMPVTRGSMIVSLVAQVWRQALHLAWPTGFVGRKHAAQATLLETARIYERLGQIYYLDNEMLLGLYATVHGFNVAEAGGSSPELARLCGNMCVAAGLLSLHILAEAYDRRAKEIARSEDHLPALTWVLQATSVYAIGVGKWAEARDTLSQAVEITDHVGDWRRWIEVSGFLALIDQYQGAFARAAQTCADIYTMACHRSDLQSQAWGLTGRAKNLLLLGQLDEAVALSKAAAALRTEDISRVDTIRIYGLLALTHVRRDEVPLARQAIETVAQLIGRVRPTAVHSLDAYTSLAEVYLVLWAASPEQSPTEQDRLAQAARQACETLHAFARVFPIGWPQAWLWQGLYEWLADKPARSRRAWRKALAAAEQLAMPYEQGLVQYEIGRHATGPERQEHLARACEIFARLGAAYDLARAEAATHGEVPPAAE